jgi:hypothetical protein
MDWPVVGAVSAAVIVTGAVTFELVVFMQSGSMPVKRAPQVAGYSAPVERSAYELPGFSTGKPAEWTPTFPLIPLIDSVPEPEGKTPAAGGPAGKAPPKKAPAATVTAKPAPSGDLPAAQQLQPSGEVKTAKLTTPEVQQPQAQPPRIEQWRVVVTSKASYFNLGGHVDSAGVVDSLASSHLRDALKSHRNFPQLPPDIRTHILTQNINLTKVAPYRGLLGMNDKTLEEEQAVRFERVAAR